MYSVLPSGLNAWVPKIPSKPLTCSFRERCRSQAQLWKQVIVADSLPPHVGPTKNALRA
jgi:hypothetical protein